MVRIRLVILMLLAFLWFGNQSCPAQWQVVKYKNREYVTLRSFCEFYGFRYEPLAEKKGTTLLGQRGQVKLALKSRDVEVNGVKYNLSFPVESNGRDYIISKTDVNSLFEPVLRPYRVRRKERATTIIIDAGHGGSDSGAIGRTGTEKKFTLDTAFRLKRILERMGYRTIMTRTSDVFIPLDRRAQAGAGRANTIFVSIHFNKGQSRASGIETFALAPRGAPSTGINAVRVADFQGQSGNRTDEQNILLATAVHRAVMKNTNATDRGVKRARFWVLRYNNIPAILFEGGFLSNPQEARLIARESYRETLARSIAEGIVAYNRLMEGGGGSSSPSELRAASRNARSDDDEEASSSRRPTIDVAQAPESAPATAPAPAARPERPAAPAPTTQSTPRPIGRGLVTRQPVQPAAPPEPPAPEQEPPAPPAPAQAPRPAPRAATPPTRTTPPAPQANTQQPAQRAPATASTPAPRATAPAPAAPRPSPPPTPQPKEESVSTPEGTVNIVVVSQPDAEAGQHLKEVPSEISVSKLLELATNAPPEKTESKPAN